MVPDFATRTQCVPCQEGYIRPKDEDVCLLPTPETTYCRADEEIVNGWGVAPAKDGCMECQEGMIGSEDGVGCIPCGDDEGRALGETSCTRTTPEPHGHSYCKAGQSIGRPWGWDIVPTPGAEFPEEWCWECPENEIGTADGTGCMECPIGQRRLGYKDCYSPVTCAAEYQHWDAEAYKCVECGDNEEVWWEESTREGQ